MTPEAQAQAILAAHGIRYRAGNPVEHEHGLPMCGMCHHFDVVNVESAIANALRTVAAQTREADAQIAESEPYRVDWTQGVDENCMLTCKQIAVAIRQLEGRGV